MGHPLDSGHGPTLRGRLTVAVLLTVGFYGLALVVAIALLAAPYLEWILAHRVTFRLAAVCVIAAGAILWSIIPRRDRFVAPGPQLSADRHPRLFERLEHVAGAVAEPMPKEVYLTADVNAGVLQRGGVLGTGGRRVMLLGLPLLHTLSVSELEGVLVHEFGHYYGGDVKLGPWIYRTREAIGRTLHNLSGSEVVRLPFLWYGRQFLRVTQAISRQQEFAADGLAARIVGSGPLISGLTRVHRSAIAFSGYWQEEYVPVLRAGFMPPLLGGFDAFIQHEQVSASLDRAIKQDMERPSPDPFDSHPTLADRIAALQTFSAGVEAQHDEPADSLLGDLSSAETALLEAITVGSRGTFRVISWDDVGQTVIVPRAQEASRKFAPLLTSTTISQLPEQVERAVEIGRQMQRTVGQQVPNDPLSRQWGLQLLADLLTASLAANGWSVDAQPGAPVALRQDGKAIEPFAAIGRIASRETKADDWREEARSLGIAALPLTATQPTTAGGGG